MNVLFIYPDICLFSGGFQQGLGYISALLKKHGHDTDLIAFSTVTNQYHNALKFAGWIKQETDLPIIIGGIHPMLDPDSVLNESCFDMVCVGEGEYPLLELANLLEQNEDITGIQNIYFKKNGKIIRNSLRPLIQDLDSLPFPDREIFDFERMLKDSGGAADIMAGRGCPFSCTYCCNHSLKEIYRGKGRFVRIRSPEHIISEIKTLLDTYNIKKLNFNDDTFTLFPEWVEEFCEKYRHEIHMPFLCNVRPETASRKVLEYLKKAGCEQIRIGIDI